MAAVVLRWKGVLLHLISVEGAFTRFALFTFKVGVPKAAHAAHALFAILVIIKNNEQKQVKPVMGTITFLFEEKNAEDRVL